MDFSQQTRYMNIVTPLGPDIFAVEHFYCRDAISELFHMDISVVSKLEAVNPVDIVGHPVTVNLVLDDGSQRPFHGFVAELRGGHKTSRDLRQYELMVVPWLWFLTRRQDCRIFQGMSVVEIVESVFQELGFSDYRMGAIMLNHPTRDYCVQYRESDFAFISRLLEEEGIFYFWEHSDSNHTLVLSDDKSSYITCPESLIPVIPGTSGIKAAIKSWTHQYRYCSGKWSLTDYNFEQPSNNLAANTPTLLKLKDISKFEVYDYPGEYAAKADGTPLSKVRMEATEAAYDQVSASSECKTLFSGGSFTVQHDDLPSEDKQDYAITCIEHTASDQSYTTGGKGFQYTNTFTCIPAAINARSERKTPRPQIHGSQTAVVVGPSGEEIYVDEFSRVKVQFHWDRLGSKNETSSCWIRVAQNWAGKKWGQIFIPRIGQEVVVSFLEGDPDRPLIIGSVYNGEQMPPYELPANKTQSGIKTRSSKGGDTATFNEIRFEDKKGSEELYIHAEKDQNSVVENDRNHSVGHDKNESVGNNKTVDVTKDLTETIGNNKAVQVAVNHSESIGSNMTISVGSSLTETVGVNYAETVGGAMEVTVGMAYALTVGINSSINVGGSHSESIGSSKSESIGKNSSLDVSDSRSVNIGKEETTKIGKDKKETVGGKTSVDVAKEYVLNAKKIQLVAKDELSIKVGSAQLIMKKNGDITLKGKKINVKGSGDVVIKGSQIKEN